MKHRRASSPAALTPFDRLSRTFLAYRRIGFMPIPAARPRGFFSPSCSLYDRDGVTARRASRSFLFGSGRSATLPASRGGRSDAIMKIGYLVPEFPGQTHIFFWREMRELRKLGVEVEVVSTRRPDAAIMSHAWTAEAMATTTYLWPPSPRLLLSGIVRTFFAGPARWWEAVRAVGRCAGMNRRQRISALILVWAGGALVALSRRRGWSHVHVHSSGNSALITMFARILGDLAYSLTLHGPLRYFGRGQNMKWSYASFGIAVTQRLRDDLLGELPMVQDGDVDVAAMGVDLEVFARRRPYAPSAGGRFRVVTCGRLHVAKGHQDLILAVSHLRKRGRDVALTILGEGPAGGDLERLIDKHQMGNCVFLKGAVSEEGVRDTLEDSHLFSLGSHEEAIGVATMEAMAMELPVVVTDVGGVRELVRDGVDGLLVPARCPERIAQALESLIDDPRRCRAMGEEGARRVRASFGSEHSARVIVRRLRGAERQDNTSW